MEVILDLGKLQGVVCRPVRVWSGVCGADSHVFCECGDVGLTGRRLQGSVVQDACWEGLVWK